MDKFCVFVYVLMRDASLKQRIPCIMHISIFGAFSAGKKCALYTGRYGTVKIVSTMFDSKHIASFTGITLVHKINVRPWTRSLYLSS